MSIGGSGGDEQQAFAAGLPGFGPAQPVPGTAVPETAGGETGAPFAVTAPTLSLPKGGGAIRGIGEKFTANPVTGTASFTVPIATSPGRSGFAPTLALSYDSGNANSAYGFGWVLDTPHIARKTNKGLPRYIDSTDDSAESDVFILSGAEDLVPVLDAAGRRVADTRTHPGYVVHRYRPRIEGLFARIERWTRLADGDTHWRSISRDNILTVYGDGETSRIADPADPRRVFSWLISQTRDDRGNGIVYDYKPDDGEGIDLTRAHQGNRGDTNDRRRATNRYLKRIRYGNRAPLLDEHGNRPTTLDPKTVQAAGWMFELVLDYGEHDPDAPTPAETRPWPERGDSLSTYRPGFEVRTTRLCRRFLMFHHFPDEPEVGADCLVRSTDLTHADDTAGYAYLQSVAHSGYRRTASGYLKRSLPPVDYTYSQLAIDSCVYELTPSDLENLPVGVDEDQYQPVDLHGEGIAGILTRHADSWWYRRNISPISSRDVEFAPLERVPVTPHATAEARFMDLGGDGHLDLVDFSDRSSGCYAHDDDEGWNPYRPFPSRVNRQIGGPGTRFIDLDGDGLVDLMITEDNAIVWHQSLGLDGFGPAASVPLAFEEEQGPTRAFINDTETIHLADISGDGLSDIVRIRNGEICYWPNLGYGRFGPKVVMDNAPCFDDATSFDPTRLLLADVDATGTTDLIYLHRDGVRLWFNQSGNGWSPPTQLPVFPGVDHQTAVTTTDLRGNGTTCLLWSSPHPGDTGRHMRYVDLMGGIKPHLLIASANNLGAETRVSYASSTKFYLQDKRAGKPWITRLAFPVHVVESVETWDWISRNRFVTRYAYHHGYFDAVEREFRGFGMVEHWDTEQFGSFNPGGSNPLVQNESAHSYVPPVHTKTWFHTGICIGRDHISDHYAGLMRDDKPGEYYREPGLDDAQAATLLLPDTVLPAGLTLDEEREACRALKGMMLRQETYADDAPPHATPEQLQRAATPYTVIEQNFAIRTLQTTGPNRHAVFFTHPLETLSYHYERNPADPRTQHAIALDVDDYGNVLKDVAIGYGRRAADPDLPTDNDRSRQTTPLITYTERTLTNPIDGTKSDGTAKYPADHRAPLPADTRTYELTGFTPKLPAGRFTRSDFATDHPDGTVTLIATRPIAYEDLPPAAGECRRLIEHVRTYYRPDDFGAAAGDALALKPLGQLGLRALAGESYKLAFTPGLLTAVFVRDGNDLLEGDPGAVLGGTGPSQGGYQSSNQLKARGIFPLDDEDGSWWIPSGRTFLSPARDDTNPADEHNHALANFFLPYRYRTPFDTGAVRTETVIGYDAASLLVVDVMDPVGNRVTAAERHADGTRGPWQVDYRVLEPFLVCDANRNRTQIAFDTLGMVIGMAIMGKPVPELAEGDTLQDFTAELTQTQVDSLFEPGNPYPLAPKLLKNASTRIVYDLHRFVRSRAASPTDATRWLAAGVVTLVRETHAVDPLPPHGLRIQLSYSYSDGFGREIQKKLPAAPGPVINGGPHIDPRWVGTGWSILNNKGKPVRQYEPFFTASHTYEYGVAVGVSPVLFYDPLGRVVTTLYPNNTYSKVVIEAWKQTTFDTIDTSAPSPTQPDHQTGDPRTDADTASAVTGYFAEDATGAGWLTWYTARIGGALGEHERTAATRCGALADTPTTTHCDTLGRTFLTGVMNRVACQGHPNDQKPDAPLYTRVVLDVEGNHREVRDSDQQAADPLGRITMRYHYALDGTRICQRSMEAGQRWTLSDIGGRPIRMWDSRGHTLVTAYDLARRPSTVTVRGTSGDSDPRTFNRDIQIDRIDYGDSHIDFDPVNLNLRGRIYRRYDTAGQTTNARTDGTGAPTAAFDFKGNLLHTTRQLAADYKNLPDWSNNPPLYDERFESSDRFDAMNRVIQAVGPHSARQGHRNITQSQYNVAGMLEQLHVWLNADEPDGVLDPNVDRPAQGIGVASISYDPKGQRSSIVYKNAVTTRYWYDPKTFRLTGIYTYRGPAYDSVNPHGPPPPKIAAADTPPTGVTSGVQNLGLTYDAGGNITHVTDAAQQTIFFRNQVVNPSNDYTYDGLNRLIQATGREHLGQASATNTGRPASPQPFTEGLDPNDDQVMGTYTEIYLYDASGNQLKTLHQGTQPAQPGWSLTCTHHEPSLIESGAPTGPVKYSNRLSQTSMSPDDGFHLRQFNYDQAGNVTHFPHLGDGSPNPNAYWDYADRLHAVSRGGGGQVYYVYDANGQRIRKVWEKAAGRTDERIYLGATEIYRIHTGPDSFADVSLERQTAHITDNSRRIALVETRTIDTAGSDPAPRQLIRYQHTNQIGSSTVELDDTARVISCEEYAPYGTSTYTQQPSNAPKRYRFTGKERDEETGLHYYGARFYAPWLGRWTSCDPSGIDDSLNAYQYVRSRPTGMVDPDGHGSWGLGDVYRKGAEIVQHPGAVVAAGAKLAYDKVVEPQLKQLAEAVDANMNAEATQRWLADRAGQPPPPEKPKESVVLAVVTETVKTGQAILGQGGLVESGEKFKDEFSAAVTTPKSSDALPHTIHAVGGAMQFAANAIHLYKNAKAHAAGGAPKQGGGPPPIGFGPKSPPGGTPPPGSPSSSGGGPPNRPDYYIPMDKKGNPIPLDVHPEGGKSAGMPKPLEEAEGRPHTVIGGRVSESGEVYRQTAEFSGPSWPKAPGGVDAPTGRVDWTSHPHLHDTTHASPHVHSYDYNFKEKQWLERSNPKRPIHPDYGQPRKQSGQGYSW